MFAQALARNAGRLQALADDLLLMSGLDPGVLPVRRIRTDLLDVVDLLEVHGSDVETDAPGEP